MIAAFFDSLLQPGVVVFLIPIFGILAGIVSMLLKHQRDMAKLINSRNADPALTEEIKRLRAEIEALKSSNAELPPRINNSAGE